MMHLTLCSAEFWYQSTRSHYQMHYSILRTLVLGRNNIVGFRNLPVANLHKLRVYRVHICLQPHKKHILVKTDTDAFSKGW